MQVAGTRRRSSACACCVTGTIGTIVTVGWASIFLLFDVNFINTEPFDIIHFAQIRCNFRSSNLILPDHLVLMLS